MLVCVASIDVVTTDVDTTDVTTSTTAPTSTMAPTPNLGGLIAAVAVITIAVAIIIVIVVIVVAICVVRRRGKQFENRTQSDDNKLCVAGVVDVSTMPSTRIS
jgi:heme/copper-type cytochrome/quinol oxidase subunit 2